MRDHHRLFVVGDELAGCLRAWRERLTLRLFRLAGHMAPGPGTIDRHVTPSPLRLLDRLAAS